jgi:hypothetical protein
LLGCTDRRAELGIHRTQAGRIGSSPGHGQRVEARCTTTSPATYSATSATAPAAPAAGRCHPCARPGAGPGEKPLPPLPAAAAGPGAVPHRHRSWAAGAGPGAVPRRGLLSLVRGTRLHHRTRPPERAGVGARPDHSPAGARWPLTVPHVADRPAVTRAFGRAGSPDCSATRWAGRPVHGATRWGQFRAGVVTERSPQDALLCAVPRTRRDHECGPEPGLPRESSCLTGRGPRRLGRAAGRAGPSQQGAILPPGPGRVPSQSGRRWGTDGPPAFTSRSSRARGPGPGDPDYATAGAAGRAVRTGGRQPAPMPSRATRTTPLPEPRAGRRGRPGPGAGGPALWKGSWFSPIVFRECLLASGPRAYLLVTLFIGVKHNSKTAWA